MGGIGAEGRKEREPFSATPTVVSPTASEAKAQATLLDGPKHDGTGVDGVLPNHIFDLDFTDARGRRWTGRFKCHVLTYREKVAVGLTRARLAANAPPFTLDIVTGNLLEMQAHLAIALDAGPSWAKDLGELYDPAVVTALYEEVANHEARFHRPRAEGTGEGSGSASDASDGARLGHEDGQAA